MSFLKKRYILIFIALAIIGGAGVISYGFLPMLKVEGEYVSYSGFLKVYRGVEAADRLAKKNPPATSQELTRRAFETIIDNKFLDVAVRKTNAGIKDEARKNVEQAVLESKDLSLEEAARKLYGLSAADFKKLVLIPAAEKDLLFKHYEYNTSELDALWDDLSQHGEVKIYYPGYEWRDGEVKIKD